MGRTGKENNRLMILAVSTGFVALLFELIWTRYMSLLLGGTTIAVGLVLAVYMLGLTLGDVLFGRLTSKNPKLAKILILGGVTLFTLVSPLLYQLGLGLVRALSVGGSAGRGLLPRLLVAVLLLLPPTTCIGGILPLLTSRLTGSGGSSSRIYALHTLGSVVGALVSGLALIPGVGLRGTLLLGGVISGLGWLLLPRRGTPSAQRREDSKAEKLTSVQRQLLVAYGVSGFAGMAFQLYQTRLLTLFFMDSVYDFALILAVYLTGLFLGNWFWEAPLKRAKNPRLVFGLLQLGLGIVTVGSLWLTQQMPFLVGDLAGLSFWAKLWPKLGYTIATLLLPAFLWGGTYPIISRFCLPKDAQKGRVAGLYLGVNTLGSCLGSLAAAFLLIESLGLRGGLLLNALLHVMVGVLLVLLGRSKENRRWLVGLASGGVVFGLLALLLPPWNQFEMSTSFLKAGQAVEGAYAMPYYQEDAYGITSVVEFFPNQTTYLTTNRLYTQNTSGMNGPEDHRRLGMIPLLLHEKPDRVLVAGLGAGVTLRGVVVAAPETAVIDCVELSASVVEAAGYFETQNNGVLKRENVTVIVDDARHYFATSRKHYDVIVSDIFFPMSSGSSGLFSAEFYEDGKELLNPGGILVQWIPLHQFSWEEFTVTNKTFTSVFPYSSLWYGMLGDSTPVVGMVGSVKPLKLSLPQLEARFARIDPQELAETALVDSYMLLSHYIAGTELGGFPTNIGISRDDRPLLEYQNPRQDHEYGARGRANLVALTNKKSSALPLLDLGAQDPAAVKLLLDQYDREIVEYIRILTRP